MNRWRARKGRPKGQQTFVFRTWGGKRRGAGRKQVHERKSQPHRARPQIRPKTAIIIALRVAPSVRRMRRRDAHRALGKALLVVLPRTDFRVVHISIQANHLHLAVEADSTEALARGMQAFQISAARRLNRVDTDERGRARRGPVFPDRYHMEIVTGPTHARHALAYVLNNWRKHKEDRASQTKTWTIDPYSSALAFDGWSEGPDAATRLLREPPRAWPTELVAEPLPVSRPQTWLLDKGWKLGGAISIFEQPSRT